MMDTKSISIVNRISDTLEEIRRQRPLIHNITNYVVMNFTANALLSIGASPIMAHAPEEMEEMVALANALVINIGTLSTPWVNSMILAARAARLRSIPVILDPVGAGATRFRTETAKALITQSEIAVIRGNASEILALAEGSIHSKGVDSVHDTDEGALAASALWKKYDTVVAVTGSEDFVTDGNRSIRIRNGHPLMSRVTGTGCVASAITGAFAAVESDALMAAAGALLVLGTAGELAARSNPGPGSFHVLLLDELHSLAGNTLRERARIEFHAGKDERN